MLAHPAFFLFLYGEWSDSIAYVLQTKYNLHYLNSFGFDGMGKLGMFEGQDMALWNICNYFGWNCKLIPFHHDACDELWIFNGAFCPYEHVSPEYNR